MPAAGRQPATVLPRRRGADGATGGTGPELVGRVVVTGEQSITVDRRRPGSGRTISLEFDPGSTDRVLA